MIEDQDVRRISHNILNNPLGVAVVRGDILVANSTPTLARKAVGAVNTALTSDGTDPSYTKISTPMITPGANDTIMHTTGGAATWTPKASLITAPGLVFISSQTANNSATIDFTSGIDATYDEYYISLADVVPVTDTATLWMRVSQSASFLSGATDYQYVITAIGIGVTLTGSGSTGDTKMILAAILGNSTGETLSGGVQFFAPAGTARYKNFGWSITFLEATPKIQVNIGGGQFKLNTSAIDGVQFLMSTGNISTGTFTLYGLRKS